MYILGLFAIAIMVIWMFYGKLQRQKKSAGLEGWVKTQDLDGQTPRFTGIMKPGYRRSRTSWKATKSLNTRAPQ